MLFPRAASDPITVGPYTLTQCIGQGGMAVVYKAKRQGPAGFEKTVVVKAMLPGLTAKKELVDLFRAEAKLSAQLNHPNIVQVHDFGVTDGVPFLVMEYLNGRNLTQLRGALSARSEGRLPIGAALAIARDICHALAYAHDFVDGDGVRRQIIHRDVSPSNVMLCRDGSVKLLDFGVAKVAGEFDCDVTQSFRGKYAYMAPEQVNRQPIDRRVDVFACGTVLHEMLTGKRLFAAPSELETLERVSAAQVVAPSVDNKEVPRALDAVVKRALARDPAARYASGAEMAEALEELDKLTWSRKKLAAYLSGLFPDAYTITCEVCGKQVEPGELCTECGSEATAHLEASAVMPSWAPARSEGRVATAMPQVSSEPLPLPPPPTVEKRTAPRLRPQLRVVHTPVPEFASPSTAEARKALQRARIEAAVQEVFEGVDHTPPESRCSQNADGAPTWLKPLEPARESIALEPAAELEHVEPASVPPAAAPRLFVVGVVPSSTSPRRADEDSIKMGRSRPTPRPAPQPEPPRPISRPIHPSQIPALRPLRPTLRGAQGPSTLGRLEPTPDLRRNGTSGWLLAVVFVAVAGLSSLGVAIIAHRSPPSFPAPILAVVPSLPEPIPAPMPASTPVLKTAPVTVTAMLPAGEALAPSALKAPVQRATWRHRVHRERAAAAESTAASPRSTVREGRIVDPFAGTD